MTNPLPARSNKLEAFARVGYGARGVVYIIVGWLAAVATIGSAGQTTDLKGALQKILGQPFGDVLLGIVAIGLLGHAVWRFLQGALDADHHGRSLRGLVVRGGLLVSGATYVTLTVFALGLVFSWGMGGSGGGTQDWTAWLMRRPFGQWLVGAVGFAVVGVGLAHFVRAWTAGFEKRFAMDERTRRLARPICRFGLFARGVVFVTIGGFLVVAAVQADPGQARGLAGALGALENQSYGWALLGVVALGLVAFGLYSLIAAVYRRVRAPT